MQQPSNIDKNFIKNFQNFLRTTPKQLCFSSERWGNFNGRFLIFFEKYAKCNLCNFIENCFLIFGFLGGLGPRTPLEADHNLEPQKFFPAFATDSH